MIVYEDRIGILGTTVGDDPLRLRISAATLGELIEQLEWSFSVRLEPAPDGCYFSVKVLSPIEASPSVVDRLLGAVGVEGKAGCGGLLDIHIERDGETLCPKQDLDFALCAGDRVFPAVLFC